MMKKFLCILLCLVFAVSAALAETADTLPRKFVRQLTGGTGNGIRGKMSITASGVAEWLNVLLPFTASEIQIRALGEKQGELSDEVSDDDDWQIRLYAQNNDGQAVGTTWLYGNPEGIYLRSELLPDTLLTLPVEQVNLLYQVFKGEYTDLFFAFDPVGMTKPGANGNASAYQAIANMFQIPAEEWALEWMPVLEKYFLHLDLWLTSYGDPSFMTGDTGALTMSATYSIPSKDIKKEAKYLIGQMLYDTDLQNLLLPYVTLEQRITYLNPSMVYFYEACIDALPLEGDVVLAREMSSMGEIVSTSVSLPIPALPDNLIAPISKTAASMLDLPYEDLLSGMNRISMKHEADMREITLSGAKRTMTMTAKENIEENGSTVNGAVIITPAIGVDENSLSAAFTFSQNHRIYQDENYLDHDTTEFSFSIEPDLSMLSEDDPFRNTYVDFSPLAMNVTLDYSNNTYQQNKPVQINFKGSAKLPDAQIDVDVVLRITTNLSMTTLPTTGGENVLEVSDERWNEILELLTNNGTKAMSSLYTAAQPLDVPVEEPKTTPEAEQENAPASEPTAVPPMSN